MKNQKVNARKVAMIGCGFVGSASVYSLMQSGLFSEIVLIDANHEKAEGEALDISHGLPFAKPMNIHAGDYDDIVDALSYYVDSFENWNDALVHCYEMGKEYTTGVLIDSWKEVLNAGR